MKTYFVTGNDTSIGKTRIAAALTQAFLDNGSTDIQIIKPVEAGVGEGDEGDISWILSCTGNNSEVRGHTCFSLKKPLSPHTAAEAEGVNISLADIKKAVDTLPKANIRIVEGAGGIASPISSDGMDSLELAKKLNVDALIIVVENRLGSINQAKLLSHYVKASGLNSFFWLNETRMQHEDVLKSNFETIKNLDIPILANQGFEETEPSTLFFDLLP